MKKIKKIDEASPLPNLRALIRWYEKNKRLLPWRNKIRRSAYTILVSEFMLQQTTVNAVIPYYEKFIKKFKTLKALAITPLEEVLPFWSGLGYYSRIKNLHKSARLIHKKKYFPKTYKELLDLPGFGPYTSRAVSSLAFNEKIGVLDANVIRVITRFLGFKKIWWNTSGRKILQNEVDKWMETYPSSVVNQALMELGALICKARKPFCLVCPLKKNCQAFEFQQTDIIPLAKKQNKKEIWLYQPIVLTQKNQIALMPHHPLPVLKNYPAFPGKAFKRDKAPNQYDFIHSITHHIIYVSLSQSLTLKKNLRKDKFPKKPLLWVKKTELKKQNPSSLLQKILSHKARSPV